VDPKTSVSLGKIDAVGGFLVGGASLKPDAFLAIADALDSEPSERPAAR
jgi:triosephosphate isomerase